ncbi:MAG: phosphatidate cytidylyltransferase, partial [Planctomycetota bacterium]
VTLAILGTRELARILADKGIEASRRAMGTSAVLGLMVMAFTPSDWDGPAGVAIVAGASAFVLVASLVFYSRGRTVEGVVAATGGTLWAFVYLGLMLGAVVLIRREHSVWVLLWVVLVTKSCDIGAYFTGKSIVRHKLIVWLSPGKTWEGLIGGVVFSGAVGAIGVGLIGRLDGVPEVPWWSGLIVGVLLGLAGQAGDLIASLLKRDAGRKDSGGLLPGFGGVLDVIDSPLVAMPVAYAWLVAVA